MFIGPLMRRRQRNINIGCRNQPTRRARSPVLFRLRENADDAKRARNYYRAFWLGILIVFSKWQAEKTLRFTTGFLLFLFIWRRQKFKCLSDRLGGRCVIRDA